MDSDREEKLRLIKIINDILKEDERQLTVDDFDVLYDLDIDQLVDIKMRIDPKPTTPSKA